MKREKLLKLLGVDSTQVEAVQTAVAAAEKETSGEIALAAVYQSDSYAFVELTAAFCTAFAAFFILFLFSNPIWTFLEHTVWVPAPSQLTAVIGIGTALTVLVTYFIMNIPAVDRLIIPNAVKGRRVYARALQHFAESGVYRTAEHTGILIFISILERKVFVIADAGITEKVPQADWERVCGTITGGLKAGATADALISAIKECGRMLHQHFPVTGDNPNELPDGLVLLES